MKLRLLESIRCPDCQSILRLNDPTMHRVNRTARSDLWTCRGICPYPQLTGQMGDCTVCLEYEVMEGALQCSNCHHHFAIEEGVPRLLLNEAESGHPLVSKTALSYSYLWNRSAVMRDATQHNAYHVHRIQQHLPCSFPQGLILDAGCGQGIDLVHQARRKGVEIVGIELSSGGCRISFERSFAYPAAHVVQANLIRLPFAEDSFDFIYSYGVLHHLVSPARGMSELARVLKPGGRVAAYLYEDFGERAIAWRWLLALVNQLRYVTRWLPHRLLYVLCQAAAPVIYLFFTTPSLMLRRIPGFRSFAASLPFHHATGLFSLAGDLYDRFSAPIEWRYSRTSAVALFQAAGLEQVDIAHDHGWVVSGVKPC